jgi:hypothetical protein
VSIPARAALGAFLLVVLGVLAFEVLEEAFETRPDARRPGSRTEVVLDVETKRYRSGSATAATALWATCSATVSNELVGGAPVALGGDRYRLTFTPELGEHGRERVVGCLGDLTVDRVRADVVSVRDLD